jgi:hypothetical protein
MVKVVLEVASNGVIKTVVDDNINGAGDKYEKKVVYEFNNDLEFRSRINFLYELCEELDIETGNKFDKTNLIMSTDWGRSYMPTDEELESKMKKLNAELKYLKTLKKELDELNEKD